MARPCKLNDEVKQTIVGYIRLGATHRHAAQAAGISEPTFYRWMDQGRTQKRGKFRELRDAVARAESEGLSQNLQLIRRAALGQQPIADRWEGCPDCLGKGTVDDGKAGAKCVRCSGKGSVLVKGTPGVPGDWRAAAWIVERRFPHEYGRQVIEQQLPTDESYNLSPDELQQRRDELLRRLAQEGALTDVDGE